MSSTPTRGATGLGIQQASLDEILRKSFAQNDSADVPDGSLYPFSPCAR